MFNIKCIIALVFNGVSYKRLHYQLWPIKNKEGSLKLTCMPEVYIHDKGGNASNLLSLLKI